MKKPRVKSSAAANQKPGEGRKRARADALADNARYVLRLYVSGSTSRSTVAVSTVKRVCEQILKNRYDLEVIDIYQQPNLAREDRIVAVPTLIKRLPLPMRRLLGVDLSNEDNVLRGLDLRKRK